MSRRKNEEGEGEGEGPVGKQVKRNVPPTGIPAQTHIKIAKWAKTRGKKADRWWTESAMDGLAIPERSIVDPGDTDADTDVEPDGTSKLFGYGENDDLPSSSTAEAKRAILIDDDSIEYFLLLIGNSISPGARSMIRLTSAALAIPRLLTSLRAKAVFKHFLLFKDNEGKEPRQKPSLLSEKSEVEDVVRIVFVKHDPQDFDPQKDVDTETTQNLINELVSRIFRLLFNEDNNDSFGSEEAYLVSARVLFRAAVKAETKTQFVEMIRAHIMKRTKPSEYEKLKKAGKFAWKAKSAVAQRIAEIPGQVAAAIRREEKTGSAPMDTSSDEKEAASTQGALVPFSSSSSSSSSSATPAFALGDVQSRIPLASVPAVANTLSGNPSAPAPSAFALKLAEIRETQMKAAQPKEAGDKRAQEATEAENRRQETLRQQEQARKQAEEARKQAEETQKQAKQAEEQRIRLEKEKETKLAQEREAKERAEKAQAELEREKKEAEAAEAARKAQEAREAAEAAAKKAQEEKAAAEAAAKKAQEEKAAAEAAAKKAQEEKEAAEQAQKEEAESKRVLQGVNDRLAELLKTTRRGEADPFMVPQRKLEESEAGYNSDEDGNGQPARFGFKIDDLPLVTRKAPKRLAKTRHYVREVVKLPIAIEFMQGEIGIDEVLAHIAGIPSKFLGNIGCKIEPKFCIPRTLNSLSALACLTYFLRFKDVEANHFRENVYPALKSLFLPQEQDHIDTVRHFMLVTGRVLFNLKDPAFLATVPHASLSARIIVRVAAASKELEDFKNNLFAVSLSHALSAVESSTKRKRGEEDKADGSVAKAASEGKGKKAKKGEETKSRSEEPVNFETLVEWRYESLISKSKNQKPEQLKKKREAAKADIEKKVRNKMDALGQRKGAPTMEQELRQKAIALVAADAMRGRRVAQTKRLRKEGASKDEGATPDVSDEEGAEPKPKGGKGAKRAKTAKAGSGEQKSAKTAKAGSGEQKRGKSANKPPSSIINDRYLDDLDLPMEIDPVTNERTRVTETLDEKEGLENLLSSTLLLKDMKKVNVESYVPQSRESFINEPIFVALSTRADDLYGLNGSGVSLETLLAQVDEYAEKKEPLSVDFELQDVPIQPKWAGVPKKRGTETEEQFLARKEEWKKGKEEFELKERVRLDKENRRVYLPVVPWNAALDMAKLDDNLDFVTNLQRDDGHFKEARKRLAEFGAVRKWLAIRGSLRARLIVYAFMLRRRSQEEDVGEVATVTQKEVKQRATQLCDQALLGPRITLAETAQHILFGPPTEGESFGIQPHHISCLRPQDILHIALEDHKTVGHFHGRLLAINKRRSVPAWVDPWILRLAHASGSDDKVQMLFEKAPFYSKGFRAHLEKEPLGKELLAYWARVGEEGGKHSAAFVSKRLLCTTWHNPVLVAIDGRFTSDSALVNLEETITKKLLFGKLIGLPTDKEDELAAKFGSLSILRLLTLFDNAKGEWASFEQLLGKEDATSVDLGTEGKGTEMTDEVEAKKQEEGAKEGEDEDSDDEVVPDDEIFGDFPSREAYDDAGEVVNLAEDYLPDDKEPAELVGVWKKFVQFGEEANLDLQSNRIKLSLLATMCRLDNASWVMHTIRPPSSDDGWEANLNTLKEPSSGIVLWIKHILVVVWGFDANKVEAVSLPKVPATFKDVQDALLGAKNVETFLKRLKKTDLPKPDGSSAMEIEQKRQDEKAQTLAALGITGSSSSSSSSVSSMPAPLPKKPSSAPAKEQPPLEETFVQLDNPKLNPREKRLLYNTKYFGTKGEPHIKQMPDKGSPQEFFDAFLLGQKLARFPDTLQDFLING